MLNPKLDFREHTTDPLDLADIQADPGERTNFAGEHPGDVERLSREARAWLDGARGEPPPGGRPARRRGVAALGDRASAARHEGFGRESVRPAGGLAWAVDTLLGPPL